MAESLEKLPIEERETSLDGFSMSSSRVLEEDSPKGHAAFGTELPLSYSIAGMHHTTRAILKHFLGKVPASFEIDKEKDRLAGSIPVDVLGREGLGSKSGERNTKATLELKLAQQYAVYLQIQGLACEAITWKPTSESHYRYESRNLYIAKSAIEEAHKNHLIAIVRSTMSPRDKEFWTTVISGKERAWRQQDELTRELSKYDSVYYRLNCENFSGLTAEAFKTPAFLEKFPTDLINHFFIPRKKVKSPFESIKKILQTQEEIDLTCRSKIPLESLLEEKLTHQYPTDSFIFFFRTRNAEVRMEKHTPSPRTLKREDTSVAMGIDGNLGVAFVECEEDSFGRKYYCYLPVSEKEESAEEMTLSPRAAKKVFRKCSLNLDPRTGDLCITGHSEIVMLGLGMQISFSEEKKNQLRESYRKIILDELKRREEEEKARHEEEEKKRREEEERNRLEDEIKRQRQEEEARKNPSTDPEPGSSEDTGSPGSSNDSSTDLQIQTAPADNPTSSTKGQKQERKPAGPAFMAKEFYGAYYGCHSEPQCPKEKQAAVEKETASPPGPKYGTL